VAGAGRIDVDVHATFPRVEVILPYLSEYWRRRLYDRRAMDWAPTLAGRPVPPRSKRFLTALADGRAPGDDPRWLIENHLDRHQLAAAVLLPHDGAHLEAFSVVDETTVIAGAVNQLMIDEWLPSDPRWRLAIVASPHDARSAAEEIRRRATERRVVGVWLPMINTPLGHNHFWPIYEAAEEVGLPILLHPLPTAGNFVGSPMFAGGRPGTGFEQYALVPQLAMSNLSSLLIDATFERFPSLSFLFMHMGWTWLPGLRHRWDAYWQAGRSTHPHVRRAPSEYIFERCRFTTHPTAGITFQNAELSAGMMRGDDLLLYASNVPLRDAELPDDVLTGFPSETRDKVFRDNAIAFFSDRIVEPQPAAAS
jgi:uncharacterized protein